MAKGGDQEIMRAVLNSSKGLSWKIGIIFCVVTDLQVWCKDMQPGSQPNANSLPSYSCQPFYAVSSSASRVVRF